MRGLVFGLLLAFTLAVFAGDRETPAVAKKAEGNEHRAIADFVWRGIQWLAEAQHENGGWGGGSHAQQNIRDPRAVGTDPATTAFVGLAFLRAGHRPDRGRYKQCVRKATEYLLKTVEDAPEEGPFITETKGTQPQAKMGQLVDTSLTVQYLSRLRRELPQEYELFERIDSALDKCIAKVERSQQKDGSWNQGQGWALVLQSSIGMTALENARAAGKRVRDDVLERARAYTNANIAPGGGVSKKAMGKSAGVELYAYSGGMRGAAAMTRASIDLVEEAKQKGKLPKGAKVSERNLVKAGVPAKQARTYAAAYEQTMDQTSRLADDKLMKGFGNNGGEEFLSYMMMAESLVMVGGDNWHKWNRSMHRRLEAIQDERGSWSGHHCITSPVFCTAAVVSTLTVERDVELLREIAKHAKGSAK
jgi:hypothetical protein